MATSSHDPSARRSSSSANTAGTSHGHSPAADPGPTQKVQLAFEPFVARARSLLARPSYRPRRTPKEIEARAGSAISVLREARLAADPTPTLFVFGHEALPEVGSVLWADLLEFGVDHAAQKSSRPGAKWRVVPVIPAEQTINTAVENAVAVCDLVRRICNGNGSDPEVAKARIDHVFGGRHPIRSRPGMTSELRSIRAAIQAWGIVAPMALQLMQPTLAQAMTLLEEARAQPGGRPPKEAWAWAADVVEWAVALDLALGALLEHALATATDARKADFQQAIDPPVPHRPAGEEEDSNESDEEESQEDAAAEEKEAKAKDAKNGKGKDEKPAEEKAKDEKPSESSAKDEKRPDEKSKDEKAPEATPSATPPAAEAAKA